MLFSLLLTTLLAAEPAQGPVFPGLATFADAVQMANEGREAEALAAFQRLASANPNDHQARLWIARLHQEMGHPDLAEAVYRSVLLEDPENAEAMVGIGVALLERDEQGEAIEMFERAERLAPQSDVIQDWLGRAHRQAGRPARSIGHFERAFALAPTEQHRLALEGARRVYFHRIETRGFTEDFNTATLDTRSGELAVDYRLNDTWRIAGRGQVQRKFGVSEERGGGGVEWRWTPAITLRGQALVGADTIVMPEGDYLGELEYTRRQAIWSASLRYFDFTGARVHVVSPAVSWLASERLSLGARYAISITESNILPSAETQHTLQLSGAYRMYPRLWVTGGYTSGVKDFESVSRDEFETFGANSVSGGVRFDLPSLTSLVGAYEYQWREGDLTIGRVTLSLAHSF